MNSPNQLIPMAEVCKRTSLSRTAIFKHRSAGTFPLAVKLSEKRVAFVATEIDKWINDRIAARDEVAA